MDTVEEGELGPSKGNKQAKQTQQEHRSRRSSSMDNREDAQVAQVRAGPRWPKYVGLHVLGHLCWKLMVCPSRLMPCLGIIAGGMLACWLRLWSSPFSSLRTWWPIGVLSKVAFAGIGYLRQFVQGIAFFQAMLPDLVSQ